MSADINQLIAAASAELDRLDSSLNGMAEFQPSDFRNLRKLAAYLKRQDDENLSLYGQKLAEVYRGAERLAALRKQYPEHARPVRKVRESILKALLAIGRADERIEADVYRKAGEKYGIRFNGPAKVDR
ncbi:hypothetical protein KDJ56_14610 [Brevibacillus composti]|uniref:Uncharacterized protein n=1 Tax=Brevibacillus composti TaxID=2796470 RepID=A0A7T5EIG4_9BACL|nr:hypothetical protein [Brevibacillus composti]QQE73152.1 hypothetical protein JD108_14665 [Brevibacillus composti]QUO40230.1 hypothetical protein KDJ56_14610 [Brevibacillus composti]